MIASLLRFDVLHCSPKTQALREKPFLARLTAPDLAGFEVRAAKASCYSRVAEGTRLWHLRLGAQGRGQGRWLCSAIMEGQRHRGFKRLVSIQKMKSSSLWIASLGLRFKYISEILCVLSHFNVCSPLRLPPHALPVHFRTAAAPLFIISPVSVSSRTAALSYLKLSNYFLKEGFFYQ